MKNEGGIAYGQHGWPEAGQLQHPRSSKKRFIAKRDGGFWNQVEESRGLVAVLLGLRV